jgi:hypothetical protein
MSHGIRLFLALIATMVVPLAIVAQDQGESSSSPSLGDFQTQGSASFGYRFTDIKGYQPMYLEMFDLQKGPRLMDFNLFGQAPHGANPFADDFSLTMSGLGGDPFPSAQLTVSKRNLYDLRVNWRQAYYYWNQNDSVILPIGMPGLTNNHDWATVRKFGSVALTLHASNNLRFNFTYYRTTNTGATFTTFAPDYLGSSGNWGFFARANPYSLFAPINDEANRFTGGLDYTWHAWNFHYNIGYQTYDATTNFNNVLSPETSIDTGDPHTAAELLANVSWTDFRRFTTPISEFSYTGKPLSRLAMRGSYIFYQYSGPATFDQSFNGVGRTNIAGTTDAPYSISQSGRAHVSEPNNVVEQGFTYRVNDWWSADLDYRYSRFTTDSTAVLESLFDGVTPTSSQVGTVWRDGTEDLDFSMEFTPQPNLLIQPGIRLLKRDVLALTNGVAESGDTLRTKTAWPEISLYYQPLHWLSVRGDLHAFDNGASYTAITPATQFGGHLVLRLQLPKKVSLQESLSFTNGRLLATNFYDRLRSNTAMLSYALNQRLSLFAGLTYEDFLAHGDIIYIRGTPPLTDFLRDQDVNRVWQGGVQVNPGHHFGMRLSGNYVRTTGVGQASGEPPAYGPLTWPLVTGTVFVDFPKAGRLSVDLQRTYYIQQIVTGNNFSANMLTLRWTRSF